MKLSILHRNILNLTGQNFYIYHWAREIGCQSGQAQKLTFSRRFEHTSNSGSVESLARKSIALAQSYVYVRKNAGYGFWLFRVVHMLKVIAI